MRKVLILLTLLVVSFSYSKEEEAKGIVIDLRTGDLKTFEGLINGIANNIQYYRDKLEDLKVVIIIHGGAYKFFLKDLSNTIYKNEKEIIKKQKELYERLKNLHDFYGVRFEVCSVGLKSRNLDTKNLYSFVVPIYTAMNGLIDWQSKGYAYMIIQ